ncbi:MAG TPA: CvpA family protein [Dehalococcoidia bacterium]|nr:CvpA family protein [Dehalococcoidia bacterium]
MNWVDIAIVATIIWFTYAAFHAGLIREVITIVGAIFAVALAGLFYRDLTPDVKVAVNDEETARLIAFAIIFGCVVLASQLLAMFIKTASSVFMLGMFDSMGGAFIGLIKAFVFIEIALIIAITFENLHLQKAVDNSAFAGFFLNALPILKHILPAEFKEAIDSF